MAVWFLESRRTNSLEEQANYSEIKTDHLMVTKSRQKVLLAKICKLAVELCQVLFLIRL